MRGPQAWHNSTPATWEQDTARLFTSLAAFDAALAAGSTIECSDEQLFQGPIADLLTHIGQIAMLRRLAGAPIRAENYLEADITKGRVGADQAAPRYEFG